MKTVLTNEKTSQSKKRATKSYWRVIKGNLYARLQFRDETGKWREKLKPISDKRTAQRVVEEMRRELENHGEETLQTDKMTFAELTEAYSKNKLIPAKYQNGRKISGKRSIAPVISMIKPLVAYFGRRRIRTITTNDAETYKNSRLETLTPHGKERTIAGVNRELEILRAMFNFAVQNRWLIENPFVRTKGIISKSAEHKRDRILSPEEEQRLLSVCTGRRSHLKPILICALDTGMRRREMFTLRWRDVNFSSNEIFIQMTNTKTEEERTVGITTRLAAELKKLWEKSPKDLGGLVFGVTDTIKTAFASACRDASIEDFHLHDCRHTATTRMIASGSPHTEVMKITGHTQLKTFLRYLNITPETSKKCAARLDKYLDQSISQGIKTSLIN